MAAPYAYDHLDVAVYTVRDLHDQIAAEFRTQAEALAFAGSQPGVPYSVVVGRWTPSPDFIERLRPCPSRGFGQR